MLKNTNLYSPFLIDSNPIALSSGHHPANRNFRRRLNFQKNKINQKFKKLLETKSIKAKIHDKKDSFNEEHNKRELVFAEKVAQEFNLNGHSLKRHLGYLRKTSKTFLY